MMTNSATRRRANARAWTRDNKPAKGHAYAERFYAYDFRKDGMVYTITRWRDRSRRDYDDAKPKREANRARNLE